MVYPIYKSTSNPPDETTNPPPPTSSSSSSRNTARPRLNTRIQTTRQRSRRHRRAQVAALNSYIPSEFLSSSYRPRNTPITPPSKEQQFVLVLSPNTTSNRRKGTYTMSISAYNSKMGLNIPNSILVNLSSTPRPRNGPFAVAEAPLEDPGFASDNESTTSEDSILSDPEWISSNRELAMELLLGSSEDEFLGSLLGGERFDEYDDRIEGDHVDNSLYEDDDMDFDMAEANDEDVGMDTEQDNSNAGARYALREVDEDYD